MISNKSENDKMIDLFLETSSGSQWKQLMFKLYRRFVASPTYRYV